MYLGCKDMGVRKKSLRHVFSSLFVNSNVVVGKGQCNLQFSSVQYSTVQYSKENTSPEKSNTVRYSPVQYNHCLYSFQNSSYATVELCTLYLRVQINRQHGYSRGGLYQLICIINDKIIGKDIQFKRTKQNQPERYLIIDLHSTNMGVQLSNCPHISITILSWSKCISELILMISQFLRYLMIFGSLKLVIMETSVGTPCQAGTCIGTPW